MVSDSLFGGLIQAAVGSAGAWVRCLEADGMGGEGGVERDGSLCLIAAAVPSWTAAGAIKPIPPWRCSWLYSGELLQ